MWKNDTFSEITSLLLDRRLGKAVKLLENYFLSHPGHPYLENFRTCASHYALLVDYWQSGYDDPERERLYTDLLQQFYTLTSHLLQRTCNENTPFRMNLWRQSLRHRSDWSLSAMRHDLEEFVSEQGLLSLEPESAQHAKSLALHQQHQQLMSDIFNYIWTSELWLESDVDDFLDILLSPTVDATDQQLMVSAVTMAALNVFDFQKFRLLTKAYTLTADPQLRQRALVGWVLVADTDKARLFTEMYDIVKTLCDDEQCRQELAELQMQLIYCLDTEADSQRIKDEIMPELLHHSNLKITRHGIEETEEDALEDILHPDASERNMEKMEESIRKMVGMQQQGADIYFGGFSQMKRFPFFNDISNWFVPFYPQHPSISETWNRAKGRKMLHLITKIGAFCDSDKYSFVLAFEHVLDRLPQNMLQMIEEGEATPMPVGGEISMEEQQKPAFIRRVYLQNLYRFFKVYPMRGEFRNPFSETDTPGAIFFASPLFAHTALQQHYVSVAAFLLKKGKNQAAIRVLKQCSKDSRNFQYYMMLGTLAQHHHGGLTDADALDCYQKALDMEPQNARVLAGMARSQFALQRFDDALQTYERLLLAETGRMSYELGAAVCQIQLQQYEAALNRLHKLNYEHPDNGAVKRTLAWAYTLSGRYEQAGKLYEQLLAGEDVSPDDCQNYGFCLWFQHDNRHAANMFRRALQDNSSNSSFHPEQAFLHTEHDLLVAHGITDTEMLLMLDQLTD